jgi:hypothetical protein
MEDLLRHGDAKLVSAANSRRRTPPPRGFAATDTVRGTRTVADDPKFLALTADIVSSYVRVNKIALNDPSGMIHSIHVALAKPEAEAAP